MRSRWKMTKYCPDRYYENRCAIQLEEYLEGLYEPGTADRDAVCLCVLKNE